MKSLYKIIFFLIILFISGCTSSEGENKLTLTSMINYENETYTVYLYKPVFIVPVNEIKPNSTCTVSPSLPAGLSMNSDCSVSGTPTEISEANNYEVTLVNGDTTEVSVLWLEVLGAENFLGVSYANSSYSFISPQWVSTIYPNLQGGYPEKCYSTPDLPAGLKIQNDCSISGYAIQPTAGKTYTIQAISNDRIFSTTLNLEIVTSEILSGLVYNFDARVPSLAYSYGTDCNQNNMSWTDLGPNKLKAVLSTCNTESGWKGTGLPSDPYRWALNNADLSFYTQNSKGVLGGDMTLSMWIRPLSGDMTIFSGETNGFGSDDFRITVAPLYGLRINDTNSSPITLSPIGLPTSEWHHMALVRKNCAGSACVTPYNNPGGLSTLDLYFDGVKVNTFNVDYMTHEILDHLDGPGHATYSIGKPLGSWDDIPHLEIAQLKMFNRMLSSTEVLNDCQHMMPSLPNAACRSGVRTVYMPDFNIAINDCMSKIFRITDLVGTTMSPGENVSFNYSSNGDVQLYSDAACTSPINNFSYSSSATDKEIFLKAATVGTKKIVLTPTSSLSLAPREVSLTSMKDPTTFKLSYGGTTVTNGMNFTPTYVGCDGNLTLNLELLDSSGQVTTSSRNRQITVSSPSNVAGLPINTNFLAGTLIQNFSILTGGTYNVTVSVTGLGSSTFTLNHPGPYDCGSD